jgi:hypothetical protein
MVVYDVRYLFTVAKIVVNDEPYGWLEAYDIAMRWLPKKIDEYSNQVLFPTEDDINFILVLVDFMMLRRYHRGLAPW